MKSIFPLSIVYPSLRNTALWNFAFYVRAKLSARFARRNLHDNRTVRSESINANLRSVYSGMLGKLHKELSQKNIPFVFLVFPSHYTVSNHEKREKVEWVTRVSKDMGIHTINLLLPLESSGFPVEETYLLPFDGHPATIGYTISAKYLRSRLVRLAYLESFCSQ
jgi:hypothetical protein